MVSTPFRAVVSYAVPLLRSGRQSWQAFSSRQGGRMVRGKLHIVSPLRRGRWTDDGVPAKLKVPE